MTNLTEKCPPLDEHATNTMRSNVGRNTKPELIVRKLLRDAGYPGYRIEWKVPGKPDISYPGRKIAIFVNGCFWHRCPHCNPNIPKHNHDFWMDKFEKNVKRDENNYRLLKEMGWTVIIVWECEIKQNPDSVTDRVVNAMRTSDKQTPDL